MKKIFSLVALVLLVVLFCFYFFPKQPNNIFDEIYQETAKNYLGHYNFKDLKNVTVKNRKLYDSNMNETDKYESIITYDDSSLGSDAKNLELRFNFDGSSKGINIWFERYANSGEKINFVIHYGFKKKVLVKKICQNRFKESRYGNLYRRRCPSEIIPRTVRYHCQGFGFLLRRNRQPESFERLVFYL